LRAFMLVWLGANRRTFTLVTVVSGKRRGRGEDSIYWDSAKQRFVGAVSLGYSASGARVRKKVMGWTKTEVRESCVSCMPRSTVGCGRGGTTRWTTRWTTGWLTGHPHTRNAVQSASRSCGKVVHVLTRVLECPTTQ
jgi:hypothetical protein